MVMSLPSYPSTLRGQVYYRLCYTGQSKAYYPEEELTGRSAIGDEGGFNPVKKDVSKEKGLFPPNPARRVSVSGTRPKGGKDDKKVKAANESDVSDRYIEVLWLI
jgi:hypothetical protein